MRILIAPTAALLAGCATTPIHSPQDQFFSALSSHCGQSLEGRLVSSDPQDADMAGKPMVARFAGCTATEVRINFAVGDDTSRNWVITRTPAGLRLKHVHLHKDGTEDELSRYGGDTVAPGTAQRQEFPADAFSKALFTRRNIPASLTNVWAVEVRAGESFAYELRRPGRFFRVELNRPR
jgi:hypothetical protein